MLKEIVKSIPMILLIFVAAYFVLGNLLHRVVFPEEKPAVFTYFKPGQQFYSKAEGFRQTVVKQENGYVHCTLEIEPHAGGPPKHIHTEFDETFEIENGELTVWVDGEIKKVRPGEKLHIPKGTPHKPYNETADTIRLKGPFAFPEKFAFYLVQIYGVMDEHQQFEKSPEALLQMALLTTAGFDSYIAEGPPVMLQKFLGFAIAPLARLKGFRSYYKKYDLNATHS